jgi:hypothetical protein
MAKDFLIDKFKYKITDTDDKRKQSLRNAYILYGFEGLKRKLSTLDVDDANKSNLSNDILFLTNEELRLSF